jgi:hypothetical protein
MADSRLVYPLPLPSTNGLARKKDEAGWIMSAKSQEIGWDRRRSDRRDESSGRDRRRENSPIGRFEAYLDAKVGALGRAAAVTAAEIKAEASRLKLDPESDRLTAESVDDVADGASRAMEHIAEEVSRMRGELFETERGDKDAPSQGAEMLVRQLANAGADASEIEGELAKLGMDHPRDAIEAVLAEPK